MKYKYPDGTARWAKARRESSDTLQQQGRSAVVHELVLFSLARVKFLAKMRKYNNEANKKPHNKERRAKYFKSWQVKNKDHLLEYARRPETRKRRHEKVIQPCIRKKRRDDIKKRRDEDPMFLMVMRLRSRFYCATKRKQTKIEKFGRVLDMCGCTKEELFAYLTANAEPGMTMANTDIDHIYPIKMYDLHDQVERKKIWHFSNLRLAWPVDNRRKQASPPSAELAMCVWPCKRPKCVV
tara:strand:- start:32 stop:748 length:717 start_codon:yes stop_codon:yes gene_type:complete